MINTEIGTMANLNGSPLSDETIAALALQTEVVCRAMATLMTEDVHYGRVPGFGKKPTLLEPGLRSC